MGIRRRTDAEAVPNLLGPSPMLDTQTRPARVRSARPSRRSAPRLTAVGALLSGGVAVSAAVVGCGSDPEPLPQAPKVDKASRPVPAISGGTLLISRDGTAALAADPDRDRLSVVDLRAGTLRATIPLEMFDEPGRAAEDAEGRVHVVLRRGGDVVTVDLEAGAVVRRAAACPAPRGIVYDELRDQLHVACMGGELVSFAPRSLDVLRRLRLDRDLRDPVMVDGELHVSRFRSAELLQVDLEAGAVARRQAPLERQLFGSQNFRPNVAWRAVPMPQGGVAMVHQRALTNEIAAASQAYYAGVGCDNSVVETTVTQFRDEAPTEEDPYGFELAPVSLPAVTLAVDVAVSPNGQELSLVAAGTKEIITIPIDALESGDAYYEECPQHVIDLGRGIEGTPIAVAYTPDGVPVVQTRQPATLVFPGDAYVDLGGESVADTGHELFHSPPEDGISPVACASCHAEGGDDAHVWNVATIGLRRTQTLRGGILATAPLHWDGNMEDMNAIMDETFVRRMGGQSIGPRYVKAMAEWVDELPAVAPSPSAEQAAIDRGAALFHDEEVACATCHSGAMLTDNQSYDVGTGVELQVPALINIADRAPFMHDGCAQTLKARFTDCGGGDAHGKTSHLSESQIDDLVAYLESL